MNKIRYRIASDISHLGMSFCDRYEDISKTKSEQVLFNPDVIYFVDILEVHDRTAKLKIYMPDGRLVVGWQSLDWIQLHHVDDPFDGRFNS